MALITDLANAEITTAQALDLSSRSRENLSVIEKENFIHRSGKGRYPLRDFVQGLLKYYRDENRRGQKNVAENRVRDARATEIEMRTLTRVGKLIETDQAEAAMDSLCGYIRTELGGFASRVTRDLALREIIEKELHESLNRVATRLRQDAATIRTSGAYHRVATEANAGSMGGTQ